MFNYHKIWDLANGKLQNVVDTPDHMAMCATWHPDGKKIVSGGIDKKIMIWDPEDGNVQEIGKHGGWINSVACHPDGIMIASGGEDSKVKVWLLPLSYRECVRHLSILKTMYLVHAARNLGKQQTSLSCAQNYLEKIKQSIDPNIIGRLQWLQRRR